MKKIKELISMDERISLFQTAMNNAGRNYEGKCVSVEKMAQFASGYYKLAIKEIGTIGRMEIAQLEKVVGNRTVKKIKGVNVKKLMRKIKKTK